MKNGLVRSAPKAHPNQERRQKNFQRGATEKTSPKNSTIKPPSALSVSFWKFRRGPRCRRQWS